MDTKVTKPEVPRYEGKSHLYQLEKDREENTGPMIIIGTLNESGLGLTEWWKDKTTDSFEENINGEDELHNVAESEDAELNE